MTAEPIVEALRRLGHRRELLALLVILVGVQLLPGRRLGFGLYGLGVYGGATIALQAIGVVLVYRTHRIINFAQAQVGLVAASFFAIMVSYRPMLRWTQSACPSCIGEVTPTMIQVNYWLSMMLALALAMLLAYAIHFFVVKRFADASRLVLTVATIFVVQLLGGLQGLLPQALLTKQQRQNLSLPATGLPFHFILTVGHGASRVLFGAPKIATVAVAFLAIGVLAVYFRFTSAGVALRAAADNPARAGTLGVNVPGVSGRTWLMAGALSGAAGILTAISYPAPSGSSLSLNILVRVLAAAVIAGMASVPVAVAASVVIGIADIAFFSAFRNDVVFDSCLILLIGSVLLAQRVRSSRADHDQAGSWRAALEIRPIPIELKRVPVVRVWTVAGAAILALVVVGWPWAMTSSQTGAATNAMILAIVGLSLLVLTGWAGQVSLGQFGLAAVGGYAVLALPVPYLLSLPVGALAGSVVALLVGIPALRLRGLQLAVMTLALSVTASTYLLNRSYLAKHLPDVIDRPSFLGVHLSDGRSFYYFVLCFLVLCAVGVLGMRRSRTARALIAGRDNELAAQSLGINLTRARLSAFACSGFLAGLAGGLLVIAEHGARASSFQPGQSVTVFLMAVIGGLGAVSGPLIGAVYVGAVSNVNNPLFTVLATGGGGLAVLLFMRGGLAEALFQVRDRLLRRVAVRNRISVPSLFGDRAAGSDRTAAPIASKLGPGGGEAYVARRYELDDQWAMPGHPDDVTAAERVPVNG